MGRERTGQSRSGVGGGEAPRLITSPEPPHDECRRRHHHNQDPRPRPMANEGANQPERLEWDSEQVEELYPPSPSSSTRSSSPPQDFDVHPSAANQQYMPILDEQDYDETAIGQEGESSTASSLSLSEANQHHDYNAPPVIFNTNVDSFSSNDPLATTTKPRRHSRLIRCPVCEKPMRTFYCAKCIQKGRFVTLDHNIQQRTENTHCFPSPDTNAIIRHNTGSMCEQNSRQRYKSTRAMGEGFVTIPSNKLAPIVVDETKLIEELLQIKLRASTRKTDALKTLLNEQRAKLDETKAALEKERKQVELDKKSNRAMESKIDLIKRYIASRRASVKKRQDARVNYLDELKQHASRRVYQLTQDVFPIEEVNLLEHHSSFVNMETSPLLTFSDGSNHQIEQSAAYSIVEPWLPSNGDYSAYSLWVNDNKDQLQAPVDESPERSPAFRIGAALGYTTQFVKNIATYLDVILPAVMELDMFSRELLNDAQFSYNVAKLNANVIHLCVSQGVDVSLLQAPRTLKNLLLLFDLNLSDLGRKPLRELESCEESALKLESQLANDLSLVRESFYDFSKFAMEDDDADDGDASDSEWEISDTITNPIDIQMVEQSIQQNSYISRPLRLFSSFWTASGN